jgi:hypothetical protein
MALRVGLCLDIHLHRLPHRIRIRHPHLLLLLLLLLHAWGFRLAHKEPVVHIAQGIWHVRLQLIMPPLPIHYEFILVVPVHATMQIPEDQECWVETLGRTLYIRRQEQQTASCVAWLLSKKGQ